MVRPHDIFGFRAAEPCQGKAQLEGNGGALVKSCNAALARLCGSRRASLPAPADCVALSQHSTTMPSKVRLAANAGRLAEPANIMWTDHELWGCGRGNTPHEAMEAVWSEALSEFTSGLENLRLKAARRPLRARPSKPNLQWLDAERLQLSFSLPPGSYATAFVCEVVRTS